MLLFIIQCFPWEKYHFIIVFIWFPSLKVIEVFQVNLSWNFSGWEQNALFTNFKKFRPKTFSGLINFAAFFLRL